MAEVIHGNAGGNQLNARADKSQVYGLSGNDTLISDSKADVLLIGGSGDDSLIMFGGNGTLSGGKGSDTFELTYSADKPVSAVIEDLEPSSDRIVVNHVGDTAPQLTSSVKGNDVIWTDGGNFNLTLKSVRDNDYFDSDAPEQVWEVLELTNAEREKETLPALTLSEGLMTGASIRAKEIKDSLSHTRPNGTDYSTVFNEVGKTYSHHAENILAALSAPVEVVTAWMSSASHAANIKNQDFLKIGIGYNYNDTDSSDVRYYWTQEFADNFTAPDSVSTADLLKASIERGAVSMPVITLTDDAETFTNVTYGATIDALGGNDSIANLILNVSISGGDGDDTITNSGVNTTINAGKGNDLIQLGGANNLIEYRAGDGNDTIQGFRADSTLSIAGDEYTPVTVGNDVIVAVGDDSITLANAATLSTVNIIGTRSKLYILTNGNDEIENSIEGATIQALGGDDKVVNTSKFVTIDLGEGDDQIANQRKLKWNEETEEYETIFSADSVSIDGGAGDDYIGNYGSYVTINAGAGNDYIDVNGLSSIVDGGTGNDTIIGYTNITNISDYVSIMGGAGDDEISSYWMGDHAYIDGGDGNDLISNDTPYSTILGGTGDDLIHNNDEEVYIDAGIGNDTIKNWSDSVTIDTGAGNDYIKNSDSNVTINAGSGNDYIDNSWREEVSINGGTGDDTVYSGGESTTISGGKGNDIISLESYKENNVIEYTSGDGNDTVFDFKGTDTLCIGDGTGTYSTVKSGSDVIVSVGRGSVLLKDAASFSSSLKISGTLSEPVEVEDNNILLTAPGTYNNSLEGAIISGESGGYSLANSGDNVSISTGDGADSITNNGENVSIASGDGNDTISLLSDAQNTLIEYKSGNNLISGFGANDTLSVSSGKYVRSTVGNDVVFDFDDGSVTLLGARIFSYINVVGALSEENNLITLTEYVDTLDNTLEGATILALGGNDTIYNGQDSVSIDGGAGDDSILNGSPYAKNGSGGWWYTISSITLNGGEGNDSIYNVVTNNVTIDGGNGDNYIEDRDNTNVSIRTGDGNDTIENFYNSHVTIDSGAGNDSIWNRSSIITINTGDGDDTVFNQATNVTIDTGEGNDSISNGDENVSIVAGTGNDYIGNIWGWNSTIDAGTGDDYISNGSDSVTINAGDGNDSINTNGDAVSIDCGAGDDFVGNNVWMTYGTDDYTGESANLTINGGTGNDRISLSGNAEITFVQYNDGDGNDSIWGLNGDDSLQIGDGTGTYATQGSGDDVIIIVGEGSITLKDARNKPLPTVLGAQGTSGGTSGDKGDNDSSGGKNAEGKGGEGTGKTGGNGSSSGKGGNNGGTSSGSNGDSSANNGGNSARGTSGTSNNFDNNSSSGGRDKKSVADIIAELQNKSTPSTTPTASTGGNTISTSTQPIAAINATGYNSSSYRNYSTPSNTTTPSTTTPTQQTPLTVAQHVYAGGNQVIDNYTSGQKIALGTMPTGYVFGGGNFALTTATGTLFIANANDKVIEFTDGAGNDFVKAYAATNPGLIDGRGIGGFEVIAGSDVGSDLIFAGDNGSSLWGGNGVDSDTLVGGGGMDIFVSGKNQGADIILNASATDVVFLSDSTLSDILATAEGNGAVAVAFNTGNVIAVQSTEPLSAAFMLADGSAYRYNHVTKTWQTA